MLNTEVTDIESVSNGPQTLVLKDGRNVTADVVIGADGRWAFISIHESEEFPFISS